VDLEDNIRCGRECGFTTISGIIPCGKCGICLSSIIDEIVLICANLKGGGLSIPIFKGGESNGGR
jgi:hypothetical protein